MTGQTSNAVEQAPNEPLFNVNLGSNGGTFAPTSPQEMMTWIQRESDFWNWVQPLSSVNHKTPLDQALTSLQNANQHAHDAKRYEDKEENALRQRVQQVQSFVQATFIERKLPHSTSTLGKRIEQLRQESPQAAIAYLYAFLSPSEEQSYTFEPRGIGSWLGITLGVFERFNVATSSEPGIRAAKEAIDDLRARTEELFDQKKRAVEQLHRNYVQTSQDITSARDKQKEEFDALVSVIKKAHDNALAEHQAGMDTVRRTFREGMTLRAPVEYWEKRAHDHAAKAKTRLCWTFGFLAALAVVLGLIGTWVFWTLDTKGNPHAWKVALLVLVGVLGIWAERLIVRMFLSSTHLAVDAEERVTMVRTYLALLEGDKMPSDEDRKLVLQPLFRPASDGIVKDEGLPHLVLDWVTKPNQR